jgi:hypothetical protein
MKTPAEHRRDGGVPSLIHPPDPSFRNSRNSSTDSW